MVATTQSVNGVDLQQLNATIDAIKENPGLARFRFQSRSRWAGGARSTTTIDAFYGAGSEHQHARTHTLPGDEPEVLLGTDTGPNAVETVLAALASCLAVGYAYNAAARGIEIEELSFQLEGELDLRAFLGLRDDVRPGYEGIRVRYRVKSPASRDQLVELCDYVQRTSPVLDIVANRVPVTVDLVDYADHPAMRIGAGARAPSSRAPAHGRRGNPTPAPFGSRRGTGQLAAAEPQCSKEHAMYGTIFQLQPKAGRHADIVALMEEWNRGRGSEVQGARATYLLRSERRPGELIGVAVFDDAKAYRANADSPEQEAWYRRLRELLEVDPVWEDGEFPVATRFSDGTGV